MKPVVTNYVVPGGHQIEREYTGQIDFRDSVRGPWEVITFVPSSCDYQHRFSSSLFKNGIYHDYEMDLEELESGRQFKMSFKPFKINSRTARRSLLRCISSFDLPIVWKECRHGYEIDASGRILRKWTLKQRPKPTP